MPGQSTADNGQANDGQANHGQPGSDQAERVWAAIRGLTAAHPPKAAMREALHLGRGSGRVKALLWLSEGPLSVSGVAETVGVDAPYATLIVDALEERGLVERQPDPADRRRKLVTITDAGRDAVARAAAIQRQPPPGFANLSHADLDALEGILRRIGASPDLPG